MTNQWLAGFFDGDGCVSWSKRGKLVISISQKDRSVLDKIQRWLGYGSVQRCGQYYEFRLTNMRDKHLFCRRIVRHSIVKKKVLKKAMLATTPLG